MLEWIQSWDRLTWLFAAGLVAGFMVLVAVLGWAPTIRDWIEAIWRRRYNIPPPRHADQGPVLRSPYLVEPKDELSSTPVPHRKSDLVDPKVPEQPPTLTRH